MPSLFHQRAPQVKNKKHEDRRGEGRGGRLTGEKAAERVDVGWEMVAVGAVLHRRLAPSRCLAGTPGFDLVGKTRGSNPGRGVWGKGQAGPVFFPGQAKMNSHSNSHLD